MTNPGLQIGVRLRPAPGQVGEWIADASAFDFAGATALWLTFAPEEGLDPLTMAAAVTVRTSKVCLVVDLTAYDLTGSGLPARVHTVRQLSNGRLTLLLPADRVAETLGTVGEVPVLARARGAGDVAGETRGTAGEPQRWLLVKAPHDRASWTEICAQATGAGATGLVVDGGPVLLDILRNP